MKESVDFFQIISKLKISSKYELKREKKKKMQKNNKKMHVLKSSKLQNPDIQLI